MSILETLFGGVPAQPATPAAAPAAPGNLNPNATQPVAGNPNVPAVSAAPESPMDQFSDLWQPTATDPNSDLPFINIDPKQLADAAKKTDFSKIVSADTLAAVQQGGEAGTAALMQALNQVAQGVYAQSAFASSKIIEQAVAKAREQFNADIPAHVKKLQVSESLRNDNPVFNHPAASPILSAIESQLTVKHRGASSSEITSMAKQYLEQFADAVKAPGVAAAKATEAKNSKETDWNNFLTS